MTPPSEPNRPRVAHTGDRAGAQMIYRRDPAQRQRFQQTAALTGRDGLIERRPAPMLDAAAPRQLRPVDRTAKGIQFAREPARCTVHHAAVALGHDPVIEAVRPQAGGAGANSHTSGVSPPAALVEVTVIARTPAGWSSPRRSPVASAKRRRALRVQPLAPDGVSTRPCTAQSEKSRPGLSRMRGGQRRQPVQVARAHARAASRRWQPALHRSQPLLHPLNPFCSVEPTDWRRPPTGHARPSPTEAVRRRDRARRAHPLGSALYTSGAPGSRQAAHLVFAHAARSHAPALLGGRQTRIAGRAFATIDGPTAG